MKSVGQSWTASLALVAMLGPQLSVGALDIDFSDNESIKKAMNTTAAGMTSYYTGYQPGDVPGNLPDPYYWWEAGAMFGSLIEYWYYTGDTTWNDMTKQAILHQSEDTFDPANQSLSMGNDDQIFWGFAVMSAAEYNFTNPPSDEIQWLALAENLFNVQVGRWDTEYCNGGLFWQVFQFNKGYTYKNSISQAGLFNLATRLAKYTPGNETYAEWANTIWNWMSGVGFIGQTYLVYDGADSQTNCSHVSSEQHLYLPALLLHGAANMYNLTNGTQKWGERIEGLMTGIQQAFFPNGDGVMAEPCESNGSCDMNMRSYKAFMARFAAASIPLAPQLQPNVSYFINASAKAAAEQCSGPSNACGLYWTEGSTYSGLTGVGEQMSAMEVFKALLVKTVKPPVTSSTGGTSKGNNDGGAGPQAKKDDPEKDPRTRTITTGDKAGAGILTVLFVCVPVAIGVFALELV